MAVIVCPEKGAPEWQQRVYGLKDLGGSGCNRGRFPGGEVALSVAA